MDVDAIEGSARPAANMSGEATFAVGAETTRARGPWRAEPGARRQSRAAAAKIDVTRGLAAADAMVSPSRFRTRLRWAPPQATYGLHPREIVETAFETCRNEKKRRSLASYRSGRLASFAQVGVKRAKNTAGRYVILIHAVVLKNA